MFESLRAQLPRATFKPWRRRVPVNKPNGVGFPPPPPPPGVDWMALSWHQLLKCMRVRFLIVAGSRGGAIMHA